MTDLRPVFDLRTGAWTTRQRLQRVTGLTASALFTCSNLAELLKENNSAAINSLPRGDHWLLLNGRWLGIQQVQRVLGLEPGQALTQVDGQLVAAHLSSVAARRLIEQGQWNPTGLAVIQRLEQRLLIERPWHILDQLAETLAEDLRTFDLPDSRHMVPGAVHVGAQPLRVAKDARVAPLTLFDTENGPIVIDRGAVIGAMTVLEGPCYIGEQTQIAPHTHVRGNTAIGPVCKIGGEISCSLVQGYSNKSHEGFLGHSLVGQWVNLGAGTVVSNLKNTYGPVPMQLDGAEPAEDSGRSYLGPVIGDYVRTAVGTRLTTGSCLGTGAMIALSGIAPPWVERFSFCTDHGLQRGDLDRFLLAARRIKARREGHVTTAEEARLRALAP